MLKILVVGGGAVGTRRALWFHDAGAVVKVVAKEFSVDLEKTAAKSHRLELIKADVLADENLVEKLVNWADIVVIATDNPGVNEAIWKLAVRHRKLVNDATNAERTHIVVPYTAEVWGLRIAVTSEGKSGVAARRARDRIVKCLESDEELKTLYETMVRVKKMLKEKIREPKKRIPLYFAIEADKEFKKAIKDKDVEKAMKRAMEIIEEKLGDS